MSHRTDTVRDAWGDLPYSLDPRPAGSIEGGRSEFRRYLARPELLRHAIEAAAPGNRVEGECLATEGSWRWPPGESSSGVIGIAPTNADEMLRRREPI